MSEQEQKHSGLFREKTMEAMDSPESLNDYLRVTSPEVWLILAAVIVLLVGCILWGIFGRIETTGSFAVASAENRLVCYVPYSQAQKALAAGKVTVAGRECVMAGADLVSYVQIDGNTDPYLLAAGKMQLGDVMALIPLSGSLPEGAYTGTVVLESLQPISLLLQ